MKLRIGLVTAYPPSRASLNEYGFHLAEALREEPGVAAVIVFAADDATFDDEPRADSLRAPLRGVRAWSFDSLKNPTRLLGAIRRERPDVVLWNTHFRSFAGSAVASAASLLAAPATRALGIPSILILHNIVEAVDLTGSGLVANAAEAAVFRTAGTALTKLLLAADSVAVLLPNYAKILRDKYGAKNVLHVPHGTFGRRRRAPIPEVAGPPRILAFGKFGTYKRVEGMIEAALLLRARSFPDLEVIIAGTDSPNTPGYLASVRERFDGVEGIEFTGYVAEENVESTLSRGTVIVLPYTSTTGSSGVLHQVGQIGRAAVYPDIDDLAVLVRSEGYAGAPFLPDSTASLAEAIEGLLADPGERDRIAWQNLRAASDYTIHDAAHRYVEEGARLAGRSLPPPLRPTVPPPSSRRDSLTPRAVTSC